MITIYTVPNCPKCKMLKDKMTKKNIEFVEETNLDEVIQRGFKSAPVLRVDDTFFDFAPANTYVNRL